MTDFLDTKFQRWLERKGACWAGRKRVGAWPFWWWWDQEDTHPEYMYWCYLEATSRWDKRQARRYRLQDAIRRELGVGFCLSMYGLMRYGNTRTPTPAERKRACEIVRRVCPRRGVKP